MALPVITNNSPSAGSIAWTQFGIAYNGGSFIIPAGNTPYRYVWWLYNNGVSPALGAGNELPELGPHDAIMFLNKQGIGVCVPFTELIEGDLIVGGSILAKSIGTNEIQTHHIKANAITADEISANAIETKHLGAGVVIADHVAAGAITTDKLSVGSIGDNLVLNSSFEEFYLGADGRSYPVGWTGNTFSNGGNASTFQGVSTSGAYCMTLTATSTASTASVTQTAQGFIPVSPASSRRWYVGARMGADAATTGGAYLRVYWYDANKALIGGTNFNDIISNRAMTTTFTVYDGQVTPPSAARYMKLTIFWNNPNVVSNLYVDEVTVREVVYAAHIADLTLTASKIAANTITTDKMAIGDFTNLTSGGHFNDSVGYSNWNATTGGSIVTSATTAPYAGAGCLQVALNASSATRTMTHKDWPSVQPNDQLYYEFYVKTTSDWNGTTAGSRFRILNQAGTQLVADVFVKNTAWQKYSGTVTVPAGASQVRFELQFNHTLGTVWVDEVYVRRKNTGELIVDGAIKTQHMLANSINANVLTAQTITADLIGSNVIAAKHMVVSDFTNLFHDPAFKNGEDFAGASEIYTGTEVVPGGRKAVKIGGRDHVSSNYVSMNAGDSFYFEFTGKNLVGTAPLSITTWVLNAAGNYVPATDGFSGYSTLSHDKGPFEIADLGDGWKRYYSTTKLPDTWKNVAQGSLYMQLDQYSPYGTEWLISDIVWRRMAAGQLIVDGSILTQHMVANTINGNVLTSNTIHGDKITFNTISGNQLSANAINGMTITGATIQAYDPATGKRTFLVDGATGEVSASGEIGTTVPINDVGYGTELEGKIGTSPHPLMGDQEMPSLSFTTNGLPAGNTPAAVSSSDGLRVDIVSGRDGQDAAGFDLMTTMQVTPGGLHFDAYQDVTISTGRGTSTSGAGDVHILSGGLYVHGFGDRPSEKLEADVPTHLRKEATVDGMLYAKGNITTGNGDGYGYIRTPYIYGETGKDLYIAPGTGKNVTIASNVAIAGDRIGAWDARSVAYQNGWQNFATGYGFLKTTMIAPGVVSLTGMPKPGIRTEGTIIGIVSVAHRPDHLVYTSCTIRSGTTQYAGMLKISSTGTIEIYGNTDLTSYLAIGTTYNLVN